MIKRSSSCLSNSFKNIRSQIRRPHNKIKEHISHNEQQTYCLQASQTIY